MDWKVDYYIKKNEESPIKDFIESLPPKHSAKVLWEIDLLEKLGTNIKEPYAKPIKGKKYKGLWELRIQQGSDASRVFYFLPVGNTFILLHGFVKKGNETPTIELEMAKTYMDDYLRRIENGE
ncbi:MAG: type II toxin-antitoxin system RelE/ParE family toxin [Clostridiales bacterium]|nr:type II toxin-antitoxin system RelE/ParE family toxin [Clostridiales bacterium]